MHIVECEQNTPEWQAARLGLPTASEFAKLIGIKKDAKDKLTRATYMRRLAAEIITGEPAESFTNVHTERGHMLEPEARDLYALMHDVEPQRVGFIRNGRMGCSPDSLIGDDGILEIKTLLPELQVEAIERGEFPSKHVAQCQGALLVTGRRWIDIALYCPRLPLFVKRAYRDEKFIAELDNAVCDFNAELDLLVARIRAFDKPPATRMEALKGAFTDILMAG